MRIVYVPLEPYESRYSLQLLEWNLREFKRLGVEHIVVEGVSLDNSQRIKTGVVLDAHQRCYYAMSQMQELVAMLCRKELTSKDFILFEDMFHPGMESLGYCFDLARYGGSSHTLPFIGARCLAQTIDPDDFIHYTGMTDWMKHYEQMTCSIVDVLFVASEEMISFMTAAGWHAPVVQTGLPFGKQEVLERLGEPVKPFHERKKRVVFSSRIADEKQVQMFISLATHRYHPDVEFAILSGGLIKGPGIDQAVIEGKIQVYPMLSKLDYYRMLNDSRVLFNCSLQDWVSNTASEADTLGCNLLFPAYRSFPEAFDNDETRLYVPWSINDASYKLASLLAQPTNQGTFSDKQDGTIARTVNAMRAFVEDGDFEDMIFPENPSYRRSIAKNAINR